MNDKDRRTHLPTQDELMTVWREAYQMARSQGEKKTAARAYADRCVREASKLPVEAR